MKKTHAPSIISDINNLISDIISTLSEILNVAGATTLIVFVLVGFIYNWDLKEVIVNLSNLSNEELSQLLSFYFFSIFFTIYIIRFIFRLFRKDNIKCVAIYKDKKDMD